MGHRGSRQVRRTTGPPARRSRWRGAVLLAAAVAVVVAAGCGSRTAPPGDEDPQEPSAAAPTGSRVGPDTELTGSGLVLQQDGEPPQLCLGGVAESYPPQCSGPEVVGLDWADLPDHEVASGVTWGPATVVGTYDGETFTLTRPPTQDQPPAVDDPAVDPFPQLCQDPFRGGDPSYAADPEEAARAEERLLGRVVELDGYVTSWVSDGRSMHNVLVTGDAEEAHAVLREVWPGGLCVAQRDLPTHHDVQAAQSALTRATVNVLHSSGGGTDGLLHVGVLVADEGTVADVHEVVAPWLTADQVVVTGALRPLGD